MLGKYKRPTKEDLTKHFIEKYGDPDTTGWSPRRRYKMGYSLAGDVYEATIDQLIGSSTRWMDVGGGRSIFPHNELLSERLSKKCLRLVSVDPSQNVHDNPYCHKAECCVIEDLETDEKFDLITLRMVAEHIENPDDVVEKLKSLMTDGGVVIIYTINKKSPVPIITRITPFEWHYKLKKIFWGGEEKDTFPVQYKMNSKKELDSMFLKQRLEQVDFRYLDDVSMTIAMKYLNLLEMVFWKFLSVLRLPYPENNILAVYKSP
jgi:SAM-dependent methyltransferase